MSGNRNIRCRIHCQKGKTVDAVLSSEGTFEGEGMQIRFTETVTAGCRLGEISLNIRNESCRENANLRMEKPVRVYLPMAETPEKITAMYLFNEWWTRPAFVERYQDIPEFTQVAFFKYKNRFTCFVPMVGNAYKTYLRGGTQNGICLEMTAFLGGQRAIDEPLYLIAEAPELEEAVHKVFLYLAEYKGIRSRKERRVPEMLRYLGWCSWDAFYREVSAEKICQKAEELAEKNIPVRWMIIDDGWMSAQDELLSDFVPDKTKFPDRFKAITKRIREKGMIRWFGVWHALGGYWGGIQTGSRLSISEGPYLCKTVNGKLVPSPVTGERFYRDWYEELRREGIDFVKVDGQSAVPYYFENTFPVAEAARGMNQALEGGASYMDGAIINCMGMAMENILARPASAVSRNSDDFVPDRENGFAEHLLQNAYNSIYHNEIYCCDWDMFWTKHEDSVKHSLLRAVSGGPVYVSDKIGDTVPEILRPLIYTDGRILMMNRSAKPTEDCVFSDPMKNGVLKIHNVASWGDKNGGGIAVFNLTEEQQAFTFRPMDIPDLEKADEYWIFDYFDRRVFSALRNGNYGGMMGKGEFAWFVILPRVNNISCLGLIDKYVGFSAVESISESENMAVIVVKESGTLGWISGREPNKVVVNTVDVSGKVERKGDLYTVFLPEMPEKAVLSISW